MPVVNFSHAFTATGQSAGVKLERGKAGVVIKGGTGTVQIEKSEDAGGTWTVLSKNSDGDAAAYSTSSGSVALNGLIEVEAAGLQYRFNCTAHTSGSVSCGFTQ